MQQTGRSIAQSADRPVGRARACAVAAALLAGVLVAPATGAAMESDARRGADPRPDRAAHTASVEIPIGWPGYRPTAELVSTSDGPRYLLQRTDGAVEELLPDAFARRSFEAEMQRSPVERLFGVTGWVGISWVGFGLLGQVVFMGRMVVQWLASERAKRSIVPPAFWFMSLVGSLMLLVYFVWRWDIVGMLGQGLGTAIYLRNIALLRGHASRTGPDASEAEVTAA
jgi:lipid-A-disaccharide synthase-like uncharacterized protein